MIKKTILTFILALFIATNARAEDNPHTFRIAREVVIEKGFLPDPMVIERMHDGSFVIAGRMGMDKAAWATAVDPAGAVRWRYLLSSPTPGPGGIYPYFSGVFEAPSGGVVLCGTIDLGEEPNRGINGLLISLDKDGQLLKKLFVVPPQSKDEHAHIAYVDGCVASKNGATLIGRVTVFHRNGKPNAFHWIVATNPDGAILWQKLIPSHGGGVPSQVRKMPDGSLIVMDTEAIRVDDRGELLARSSATGLLRLVQPLNTDAEPALLDCYGGQTRGRLIRLTPDLKVSVERMLPLSESLCGPRQYVMQLYSLPDGSMVLFGHRNDNGAHTPVAAKWNASLSAVRTEPFFAPLAPWFNAATPSGKPGEFATVRITGAPTGILRGSERALYLSFIDVNHW